MLVGKVKWFNATKGYGFLTSQGVPEDVFVHHTAIAMPGYRTLKENTLVEFELTNNGQRWMASLVHPMEASSGDSELGAQRHQYEV